MGRVSRTHGEYHIRRPAFPFSSMAPRLRFKCCDEYADEVFRHHTSPASALRILRRAPQNDIAGGTCDSMQDERLPNLASWFMPCNFAYVSDHTFAAREWGYTVMCLGTGTHIAYAMSQERSQGRMCGLDLAVLGSGCMMMKVVGSADAVMMERTCNGVFLSSKALCVLAVRSMHLWPLISHSSRRGDQCAAFWPGMRRMFEFPSGPPTSFAKPRQFWKLPDPLEFAFVFSRPLFRIDLTVVRTTQMPGH